MNIPFKSLFESIKQPIHDANVKVIILRHSSAFIKGYSLAAAQYLHKNCDQIINVTIKNTPKNEKSLLFNVEKSSLYMIETPQHLDGMYNGEYYFMDSEYKLDTEYNLDVIKFSRNTVQNIVREVDSSDNGGITLIESPVDLFKTSLALRVADQIINPFKNDLYAKRHLLYINDPEVSLGYDRISRINKYDEYYQNTMDYQKYSIPNIDVIEGSILKLCLYKKTFRDRFISHERDLPYMLPSVVILDGFNLLEKKVM